MSDEQYIEGQDYSDEFALSPDDMVSYTEPRSLQDIKLMRDSGSLKVSPEFQRNFIWTKRQQSLFIDSLYRQLPIPSMCFSYDYKTRERMVIDGLQRISTIIAFMTDPDFTIIEMPEISKDIAGKNIDQLKQSLDGKAISPYDDIINVTIPITVLRGDFNNEANLEYLYTIFQRLNQGSVPLSPQEIRNCAYQGSFNDMLKKLNGDPAKRMPGNKDWEQIVGAEKGAYRMRNEERILRFFAFYDNYSEYTGNMTKFLNTYMKKNRNLSAADVKSKEHLFSEVMKIVSKLTFADRQQSHAVKEAVLIGIAKNLSVVATKNDHELNDKISKLTHSVEFDPEKMKWAIFTRDKTLGRLEKSIDIFSA